MPSTPWTDLHARTVGPVSSRRTPCGRPSAPVDGAVRRPRPGLPATASVSSLLDNGLPVSVSVTVGHVGRRSHRLPVCPRSPRRVAGSSLRGAGDPGRVSPSLGLPGGCVAPEPGAFWGKKHPEPASAAPALWSRTRMLSSDRVPVCVRVSCQVPESGRRCPRPVPYVVTAAAWLQQACSV